MRANEIITENLRKWFKEKWVRFGPDGKIRGACARGDDSEGKPKCLPQAKAHSLGKKGRKYAASKKRREDPNPERSGKAINVATKKKSNEGVMEEKCPHCGGAMFSELMINEKKDACYYKVKSRYKVWPSAYASGALVKCRKKGASNWGTGGKKNEDIEEGADQEFHTGGSKGLPMPGTYEQETDKFKRHGQRRIMAMTNEEEINEKWSEKYKRSINCSNPKGFSQRAHCQGRKK